MGKLGYESYAILMQAFWDHNTDIYLASALVVDKSEVPSSWCSRLVRVSLEDSGLAEGSSALETAW